MDKKRLSEMSGENDAGSAPKLILNQIRFNGKKGVYVFENVKKGLIETVDPKTGKTKKSYEKVGLGETIEVIFLKIRRRLYEFRKDQKALATNEHNHAGARVTLFGGEKIENGIASELREKYPKLRTQQVIYALYQGEMVRLIVKGASLGSTTKPKDVDDFYSYLSKFQGKNDEHFYEYKTILSVGEEEGPLGSYFVMHFAKGDKLEDLSEVETNMEIAFNHCKEADEYYLSKMPVPEHLKDLQKTQSTGEKEIDTVEYPDDVDEDEINAEDIPF